jgi:hydrogenase maturation protease
VSGDSFSETILVIGYGNVYREDDGLGPAVATAIGTMGLPHVETLAIHQLVPELCEKLAGVAFVILVDASIGSDEKVDVKRIQPRRKAGLLGHFSDPESLLALTEAVYGRAPETWLMTVAGDRFDCAIGLSLIATANAQLARDRMIGLIKGWREVIY